MNTGHIKYGTKKIPRELTSGNNSGNAQPDVFLYFETMEGDIVPDSFEIINSNKEKIDEFLNGSKVSLSAALIVYDEDIVCSYDTARFVKKSNGDLELTIYALNTRRAADNYVYMTGYNYVFWYVPEDNSWVLD